MNPCPITASVILSLAIASNAIAQASFGLRNYVPPRIDAPVFDPAGTPLAGTAYRAELWGGMNSNSLAPAVVVTEGNRREIVAFITDGYFLSGSGFLCIADAVPGGEAWLQVRAWEASLGATYEDVAALRMGGYGESPLFYADGGDPTMVPPELPGPLIGLQSFSLRPVPEPAFWALLGLGGLAVTWAARRQRQ